MPRTDVAETDTEMEITAEMPGLTDKDVSIDLVGNVLTIRGERRQEHERNDREYRVMERSYGAFSRSIELPEGIDADAIRAKIADGILTVTVPKPAAAPAKKIAVQSAA